MPPTAVSPAASSLRRFAAPPLRVGRSVWPGSATALGPGARQARPVPARGHRQLSCAAGFHASERDAQQVAQDLRLVFGLDDQQVSVLAPQDAAAQRFGLVSRRWGRAEPPLAQRGNGLLALGLALLLLVMAVWALAWQASPAGSRINTLAHALQGGAVLAGLVAVVLAGVLAARLQPQPRRFDRMLQSRLAKGAWAVLVLDVPTARQADVLAALRYNSRQWCAEAPHRRRL